MSYGRSTAANLNATMAWDEAYLKMLEEFAKLHNLNQAEIEALKKETPTKIKEILKRFQAFHPLQRLLFRGMFSNPQIEQILLNEKAKDLAPDMPADVVRLIFRYMMTTGVFSRFGGNGSNPEVLNSLRSVVSVCKLWRGVVLKDKDLWTLPLEVNTNDTDFCKAKQWLNVGCTYLKHFSFVSRRSYGFPARGVEPWKTEDLVKMFETVQEKCQFLEKLWFSVEEPDTTLGKAFGSFVSKLQSIKHLKIDSTNADKLFTQLGAYPALFANMETMEVQSNPATNTIGSKFDLPLNLRFFHCSYKALANQWMPMWTQHPEAAEKMEELHASMDGSAANAVSLAEFKNLKRLALVDDITQPIMNAISQCTKLEFLWFGWPKGNGFGYGNWGNDSSNQLNWNDFAKLSDNLVNLKELKLQNCKLSGPTRALGFGWSAKLTKITLYGQPMVEALKNFAQNSSQFAALESIETDRPFADVLGVVLPLTFPKVIRVTVAMEGFDEKKALDIIATAGAELLNPKLSIFGAHGTWGASGQALLTTATIKTKLAARTKATASAAGAAEPSAQ